MTATVPVNKLVPPNTSKPVPPMVRVPAAIEELTVSALAALVPFRMNMASDVPIPTWLPAMVIAPAELLKSNPPEVSVSPPPSVKVVPPDTLVSWRAFIASAPVEVEPPVSE